MKSLIPNLFTGANLFCGMLALLFIATDQIWWATAVVIIALFMDFFDGFVARLLQVSSAVGKELDSLADNVTFGAVPGFVMARLIQEAFGETFPPTDLSAAGGGPWLLIAFLVPVFSAVRLARFNLDVRQSDAFYGVATPANTIVLFSLWLITEQHPDFWLTTGVLQNPWALMGICLLSCWWLNADIRLIAFKFKNYGFSENRYRYAFMITALLGLIFFQALSVPFVFVLYFLLSGLDNLSQVKS
jgi:CDP-diacylglycerol--serine O-phosphatidyltransferase